jgi:murein DD-endopeptidase MepM/ murein hydrolase activator NlpD
MKNRKRRAALLVPPDGAKVRTVAVPWKLLIAAFVLVIAGFAGYFIPFNGFTLDVVKQNQERNLEEQNAKLRGIIRPLYRLHVTLSSELDRLDRKRISILDKFGKKYLDRRQAKAKARQAGASPDQLVARINSAEGVFKNISAMIARRPGFFDSIPLIKPVDDKCPVGARFDVETDPFTGVAKRHFGTDFIGTRGAPVVATASGTIVRVEDGRIWGKRVFINHGFGYSTVYAHLGTADAFTGKRVSKGACIGTMGISGVTSGPHLHYEVLYQGAPVDPEALLFPDVDSAGTSSLQ